MLKYILNQIVSIVIKQKTTFLKIILIMSLHDAEIPEVFDALMIRNPYARTMPQIFIDDELIGGYTDLEDWLQTKQD